MRMNAFESNYEVRYEMVDNMGVMKPRSVVELLMESAIKNCLSVGYSVFDMMKDGLGWILRGGSCVISGLPRYSEKIRIRSWASKWSPFQGRREFVLIDEKGNSLVRCSSVWAMIDLVKRLPCKVADIFRRKWAFDDSKATDSLLIKSPLEIGSIISSKEFKVMRRDMDSNMHVHNLSYVDWVFETIPEQYFAKGITGISGSFLREIVGVDDVRCVVGMDDCGNLVHNVVSCDGDVTFATGRTTWASERRDDAV